MALTFVFRLQNPHNTVFDAKRLIGRKFDDPEVQSDMKHFSFNVINKGGKPVIQVEFKGEQKEFVSRARHLTVSGPKTDLFLRLPKKSLP